MKSWTTELPPITTSSPPQTNQGGVATWICFFYCIFKQTPLQFYQSMKSTFYILLYFFFSFMSQAPMDKLFDRCVRRLSLSRVPLSLNFARFEVPVRRSPWLTTHSFWTMYCKAMYERSTANLAFILSRSRSFHFTEGLGYQIIYGMNLRRFRY